jgi:hypothetical protein
MDIEGRVRWDQHYRGRGSGAGSEDGCGLRSSSNAFMQGCFSWDPHPALACDQGICERNTLQIAGTGVCEETRARVRYCRRTAVGEMRREQQQHAALAALRRAMQTLDDAQHCSLYVIYAAW